MTYYINPIWFYLMNLSSGMKMFLSILGAVTLGVSVFLLPIWIVDGCHNLADLDDAEKKILKLFKKIIIASIVLLFIGVFVPSKEACVEMMVASQVTQENVTATKEEIYEIVDYVTDKVNGKEEEEDD